jgi:hypothetical protein
MHGMNVRLARRAATGAGAVWLAPGNGDTCILVGEDAGAGSPAAPEAGAIGCMADASAAEGKLVASLERSDHGKTHGVVAGLVPDGVLSVQIHLSDGSTQVSDVDDNVYTQELDGRAVEAVTFAGPAGDTVVHLT